MLKFFRKRRAKTFGIPFAEKRFWPPYYISFKGDLTDGNGKVCVGAKVLTDVYDATRTSGFKFGAPVPLIRTADGSVHLYRINRMSYAPGDDHIVSPKEFDIEYDHTISPTPRTL